MRNSAPSKPHLKMQQSEIANFIKANIWVDLVLVAQPRDHGDDIIYYVYCDFQNTTVAMVTQRGSHRYYTNLDRAIAWARRLKFSKIHCLIDFASID